MIYALDGDNVFGAHFDSLTPLIIFDGECMMCNSFMLFIDDMLSGESTICAYSSIGSFLESNSIHSPVELRQRLEALNSILVIDTGVLYSKSSSISYLLRYSSKPTLVFLSRFIDFFNIFGFSDFAYSLVATNRRIISRIFPRVCRLRLSSINLLL